MLGGAPSSGAQKYADALAANGLVEGQPVEFLDPETQEWRRGTVAGLKPSTTEKAWQSFLDKELVRVEMLTDSGEKKWTRVTLSPDCIRPVQDPAPAQDAAPAQGPADPPDPASAVTPSKRSLSPEPEEESPSKRQKPESRSLSSKAKGKWRVSDRPEPTEPNEPALLSASDLIPEEVDLFSQFDNLRAEAEKAKEERDEALKKLTAMTAERDIAVGAHDEIKKAAATVTENAKLISAKMEKVERELEEEKKAHDATKTELEAALTDARTKEAKIGDLERDKAKQDSEIAKLKSKIADLRTAKQNAEANLQVNQNRMLDILRAYQMGKTSWDIVGVGLQGAGLLPAPSAAGTAPGSGHQQAAPFPFPVFPGAPFVSPNFAAAAAAMRPGAVARPGMPAPPRPGVSARPQLPGPVIQHQFAAPRRNHTGYQEGSAPATAIAKPPASGSHDQPATTPARPMSVNWPVALAPQPNDLAALATKAPNPLSIAALVTPLPPTTDARAVPIVHIGSGSLLPGAPPLTATAHNPVAGPSAAAPRPSVLAPLVTHPQPVTSIQIPAEPAVTVPVANAGRPAPPTAVERVSQPSAPTAPNQPVEQQVYSGAVLFGFSVKGAWLHNNDPNGWLAAKSRLETEESQQAIDQFCRRFNHRVNGRDSSRISAEDMPAFLNEAQRAPELDFWPRATTNATTAPKERETTAANGNPSTSGT